MCLSPMSTWHHKKPITALFECCNNEANMMHKCITFKLREANMLHFYVIFKLREANSTHK